MENEQRKKIGLALGSGGVRGLAHVGVIKTLLRHGIPIDLLAGTSIGAWVAVLFALTQDIEKLELATVEYKRHKLLTLAEPTLNGGFIKGKKFEKFLSQWLGTAQFADLAIPTTVVACDLLTGEEVDIATGPVVPAVRASMTIPLMFQPMQYLDRTLVDGAIVNPLPDDIVRAMGADVVIAVNLDAALRTHRTQKNLSLKDTALRSYSIMRRYLAAYSAVNTDIMIAPDINVWGYQAWKRYFTDNTIHSIVRAGEKATEEQMPKIKALCGIL